VIVIEQITFHALEQSIVHIDSANEVLPDRGLFLVRTTSIIVTAHYFIAFSEDASMESRFNSVQDYSTFLDLLCVSGNVLPQEVSRQRNLMQSFLMVVEGLGASKDYSIEGIAATDDESGDEYDDFDDDYESEYSSDEDEVSSIESSDRALSGFKAARLAFFPKGYFACAPIAILPVSKHIKIGSNEMLYLCEHVGKAKTNQLLQAHGQLGKEAVSSPLESDWPCPGPPGAPGIEAEECQALLSSTENGTPPPPVVKVEEAVDLICAPIAHFSASIATASWLAVNLQSWRTSSPRTSSQIRICKNDGKY